MAQFKSVWRRGVVSVAPIATSKPVMAGTKSIPVPLDLGKIYYW